MTDDGASVELVEAQLLEAMGRLRSKETERGVAWSGRTATTWSSRSAVSGQGLREPWESWSFALALRLASTSC